MDLLSMLKMANIFSPSGQDAQQNFPVGSIGGPNPMGINQGTDHIQNSMLNSQPDLNAAIQGLLNPRDDQFNNYAQMIQSMPRRQDYQPSTFRKIAGAIAGMGAGGPVGIANGQVVGYKANVPEGMKIQSAITDEPYNKALSDWATKLEPTGKIAQMEANRNTNLRQIGLGEQSRQIQQLRADTAAKGEADAARARDEANRIRDERAQAYIKAKQFTMEHPTYKSYIDKDGMLVFVNPTDPSSPSVKTDIDTGKLNDMEKIDLQVQGRLSEIAARNKGSQELEGSKQANRKELEGVKQIDRLDLKQTPPGANPRTATATNPSAPKPLLPTQQKQDIINKAQKLISDRPDLKGYVVFDKNNAGNVTGVHIPPSGWFVNEQKRMEAYNLLFGQAPVPGVTQTNQATPAKPTNSIRKEIPGHPGKFAVSTDGGKTWKAE